MNINKENLEIATMISIIVAMCCVIFKAFQYPIRDIINAINPFYYYRRTKITRDRLEELEMEKFNIQADVRELKTKHKSKAKKQKIKR